MGTKTNTLELRRVKFGLLSAFEMDDESFQRWKTLNGMDIFWAQGNHSNLLDPVIGAFAIAQDFLTEKMLFIRKSDPVPSLQAQRGVSTINHKLLFEFGDEHHTSLQLDMKLAVAYFRRSRDTNLLIAFIFGLIDSIHLDHLIFLKQAKWYRSEGSRGWAARWQGEARSESMRKLISRAIKRCGTDGWNDNTNENWPVFDFIELSDIGPAESVASHPKHVRTLTDEQHWGLLSGDEGYQHNKYDQKSAYQELFGAKESKFTGRSYFLYHFAPTSCIAFMSTMMRAIKSEWADDYKKNVGYVPVLDSYIRLAPEIPCMADGIPLVVEACLVRFIELRRSAQVIEQEIGFDEGRRVTERFCYFARGIRNMIFRPFGPTRLEVAVHTLSRLELYQDSNVLWIIGGPYTDRLFNYSAIRGHMEPAIRNIQAMQSELTRTLFAVLAAFLTIVIFAWNISQKDPNYSNVLSEIRGNTNFQAENFIRSQSGLKDHLSQEIQTLEKVLSRQIKGFTDLLAALKNESLNHNNNPKKALSERGDGPGRKTPGRAGRP